MTAEVDTTIVEGYFGLVHNLSNVNKKALINKLVDSIKPEEDIEPYKNLKESYGSFISEKSADEIIEEIRSSRLFNREIEPF
jgi:hypothetical protein